jgi:hypothetical protein
VEDPRFGEVREAIAGCMDGYDLPFSASEVLERRHSDHGLDLALEACQINESGRLGTLFRDLKGRDVAGLRLVRDGRSWRLERT